ncbi:unnamed protein product [Lampetra planeri]
MLASLAACGRGVSRSRGLPLLLRSRVSLSDCSGLATETRGVRASTDGTPSADASRAGYCDTHASRGGSPKSPASKAGTPAPRSSSAESLLGAPGSFTILRSTSADVFTNLALEDWLYEHGGFGAGGGALLVWWNERAVVLGRHQNPWRESDVPWLRQRGIAVARRRSGGGTVYHDLGNVNFSFFSSRAGYDRKRNLGLITDAVATLRPRLDVRATERFDLVMEANLKVSGTAAKLGRDTAYHHCTLLVEADRALMSRALRSGHAAGLRTNATPSMPAPVANLRERDRTLTCNLLAGAVAAQFARSHGRPGRGQATTVDPTDVEAYPGIERMREEHSSWEWVYGRTPPFSYEHSFPSDPCGGGQHGEFTVRVEVKNGRIERCEVKVPDPWLPMDVTSTLAQVLVGTRFWPEDVELALREVRAQGQGPWGRICNCIMSIV